jgi:sarcosine oxidase gamma subunit
MISSMSAARGPGRAGSPLPTILLFALGESAKAEGQRIATELGLARMELKDLRAACAALKVQRPALLVASTSLKPWDREIVEDHAAKAEVPVRWVGPDDWHSIDDAVRGWIMDARQRGRFR